MAQPNSSNPYLPEEGEKTLFQTGSSKKTSDKKGFFALFSRLKPGVKVGLVGGVACRVAVCFFAFANDSNSMVLADQDEAQGLEEVKEEGTGETISIHIDGAVVQPGVYDIEKEGEAELRVRDAVDAAQGLTEEADVSNVNLAAKIEDGQKIHIPKIGEVASSSTSAATDSASNASSGTSSQSGLININTASEKDLEKLPGIGEATAKAIVEDRMQHGSFKSIEDLMRVSGIGEKKFEKIKGQICV